MAAPPAPQAPTAPPEPAAPPEPVAPAAPAAPPEHAELPTVLRPTPQFGYVESRYSARTMRNAGRLAAIALALAILELVVFGATYLFHTRLYVSTNNAQVDGDQVSVNAPSSGQLVDWKVDRGIPLRRGRILGSVRGVGGGKQPLRLVRMPSNSTIDLVAVADGTYVRQGQMLAVGYNLSQVYITARVAESDISRVQVGDQAYVHLDADPGTVVLGVVTQIRRASAQDFNIYPSPDVDPTNLQKIDQYIPVRIAPYPTDVPLYPGLNATVEIRTGS
ncbi:MAG TPA: efflux RND transporter periplasmic adaptor subunit [Pseudonocardia sp.]|jgi:multidrug resistance efflux pump